MPRSHRLTRRDLLRAAALASGGLAIGFRLPSTVADKVSDEANDTFEPNAWIQIHSDGRILLVVARSEMGQGVTTALPMLLAEELDLGLEKVEVVNAPAAPEYTNRILGGQITGGSTSVREGWTRLREAGAAAREMLVQAAAEIWGVRPSACRTRNGRVIYDAGKQRLGYAELAEHAARLPVPETVILKDPDEWRLIGTEQPRLDTPDKVCGRARFGADVRLPGMRFASVERCPALDGRLLGYEAALARAVPGVEQVLALPSGPAVVARDTWSALRGRKKLIVDWDTAPEERLSTSAIRERLAAELSTSAPVAGAKGDARAALASASIRVSADYEVPFQAHACMEPMCCTAHVTAERCVIHVPTQAQSRVVETAMAITGLPAERISVHTTYLGGGFGRRGEQDFVADAVELSMRIEQPVQVVWTREDDIRHDFYRPMSANRIEAGIDSGGRIVSWIHRIAGPSILARVRPQSVRGGIDPTSVAGALDLPYAIPNRLVTYRQVDTGVPVGFWRSVGYSQNTYVTEAFVDELARASGHAPLELRLELLADKPRHRQVLELAARKSRWDRPLPDGMGRGIALAAAYGSIVAQVAEISIDRGQIKVHRVVCAVDCGRTINPNTIRAQMQSAIVFGLTAALKGEITIAGGRVEQGNFHDYPLLEAGEMPVIDVHIVASDEDPGGVGEPGTPPIAPALANAVFALTGRPVRSLPIRLPAAET